MTEIIRRKPVINSQIERQILTGMIVSERFITEIQSFYRPGILRSDFANTVAKWCQEYYQRYKKPPVNSIEDIFRTHRENQLDPAQAELIEEFLSSISQEYEAGEKFNAPYILDQAEKHFRLSALETHRFELSKCIAGGRIDDGEALVANFKRIARQEIKGIDPFDGKSIINALDENSGDFLFKLHGDLGKAIGNLEREHLFAVVGASGIGKTWWLLYIALRALFSGYKVLFVSLEMSERQIVQRILHWLTGLPRAKYAGQVLIPVFDCIKNQNGECSDGCKISLVKNGKEDSYYDRPKFNDAPKGYKTCTECIGTEAFQPTSWYHAVQREALEISNALKKKRAIEKIAAVRNKRLKIVKFPSGELTMKGFETYLDNLEYYEGFIPDVVCLPEGSPILTKDDGLVPIEQITKNDLLWDGESWVTHSGVIYKGEKEVIEYAGIQATSDHLFWTSQGWRTLESCRRLGLRIAKTENNGNAIRIGENYISESKSSGMESVPLQKKGVWDIRNAGPFHCFTVQGVLAHNCTDYADKFKRLEREYRHGINEIWEGHKAIAQKRHCLVATGSQSSTARSGKDTKRGDWAEDIRKLNLIDIGFTINQNDWEHDNHIYRCGVAKQRHDEFSLVGQIMVLNQLRIGRPYITSCQMIG